MSKHRVSLRVLGLVSQSWQAGRRYRTWQLVSRYSIVGTDMQGEGVMTCEASHPMQGNAHEFVSWHQREWKSYQDVM